MRFDFDTRSLDDYKKFLQIRQCPVYRFKGTAAIVPDEYAARLGVKLRKKKIATYIPHSALYDYQRDISAMAIAKRKFAIFAECGYGKTLMFFEYARYVAQHVGGKVLIVSPLMVCDQTCEEYVRWYGDDNPKIVQLAASELQHWMNAKDGPQIGVVNFEAIREGLSIGKVKALIIDEASMLKSHYGAWGTRLIELGACLDWKLTGTGTPAPNDRIEYANQAVFLDRAKTVNEFLASYFINRGQTQNRWELKPHALKPFYRALADWSIFLNNPATYGWKDNVGVTPPIHVHIDHIELTPEQRRASQKLTGSLITNNVGGIGDRGKLSQIAKGKNGMPTLKPAFIRSQVDSWPEESTIIWCCKPDARISMSDGTCVRIEDVKPGDCVISGGSKSREVTHTLQRFHSGNMISIKTRGLCYPLELTSEHRVPTMEGWKTACEIKKGDLLIDATVGFGESGNDDDYGDGWIVGIYAAEGCRSRGKSGNHNTTIFLVNDKEVDFVVDRISMLSTSSCCSYRNLEGTMSSRIVVSDSKISALVDKWVVGDSCHVKRLSAIPENKRFAQGVIDGWLYGDGWIQAKANIGQTSSLNLAKQMLLIASSLGYSSSLTTGINRPGPGARAKGITESSVPWWRVGLSERVGHYSQSKLIDGVVYREVSNISSSVYEGMVHDLTVDVDHTFVAEGIVVSNCRYNDEQEQMEKMFPEAVSISGDTKDETRRKMLRQFQSGEVRTLITKLKILGFGLNLQVCTRQVFNGLNDSWEEFHQGVKRSNRIGSTKPLNVHIPVTELETPFIENVLRKAHRIEEDTKQQEQLFKEIGYATIG